MDKQTDPRREKGSRPVLYDANGDPIHNIEQEPPVTSSEGSSPPSTISPTRLEYLTALLRKLWLLIIRVWKVLVGVAVLATFVQLAYLLCPRVGLSIGEEVEIGNPLSSQTIISNDGVLPIYDVRINCIT